ncbi:hypothetical protein [Campylobacter sp. RM12651]|uniref:hypothetical protein n=1 Tax=Campylobacter sp. RM12651 TaxID=1660079 RepID=UPI001EFA4004|nr:hypothetical protein [Campylobacter sp. RM12651]ULO03730.1 hypothetical protein AVBRAN_1275 [Campylobacter sp. RM12651]
MKIIKTMILDDDCKKELKELGFELSNFHLENEELEIIFFNKANDTKKSEALIFFNANYLYERVIYQTRAVFGSENKKEIKKQSISLRSELKDFRQYKELSFYKFRKNLNEAKKDLLELARAYSKVFLKTKIKNIGVSNASN